MQKLTRSLTLAGALAVAGVLAGCGDDVTVNPERSVILTPQSADLKVGQSVTFSATVTGLSNKSVTWASDNQSAVTVDGSGKATAVAVGTATITATAAGDADVKASAQVRVTGAGVTAVVVSPSAQILKAGEFVQATANVQADPGVSRAVTWSSSNNAVATVDAGGKVTAVADGAATITAASVADPSITGSMALTVRPIQQAKVSIQAVTKGGTTQPVNFNNVTGQIDVVLNVDPGDETVTSVSVNIDDQPACTRSLSGSESQALRLSAAFPTVAAVEAVDIVCSINTAEFNPENGDVSFLNGLHTLSASAEVAGPPAKTISSSDQNVTFNNQSGFIALVSNTNTVGGPAFAINPTNGLKYVQGDVTLTLAAVNYTAGGATVSSVMGSFLGQAFSSNAPTGQVFTFTFAADDELDGYETPLGSAESLPIVTNSTLSSGTQGPTQILNIGASAENLGLTPLDSTRVDNVPPAAPTIAANPTWVNAAFEFDTTTSGVSNVTDSGVDNVSVKFYVIAGTNPTDACDLTGMTEVADAAGLAETLTSLSYEGKVVVTDALGNQTCVELNNAFGVDKGVPDVDVTAPAQGDIFATIAVGPDDSIFVDVLDTLSGPRFPTPVNASIVRKTSASSTTCVLGSGTTCKQVAADVQINARGGATENGYYTYTVSASDSAGNTTDNVSATFLYDSIAPTQTGVALQPATYTKNTSATFSAAASDNLDLAAPTGILTYGGLDTLEYAGAALGSFGSFTKTGNATFTVANFLGCINAANDTTAAGGVPVASFNILLNDLAGNSTSIGNTAIPALALTNAACGTVGNSQISGAGTGFTLTADETSLNLDGDPDPKTAVLSARVETVASESAQPFSRVDFYYRNAANRLVFIGSDATASIGPQTTIRPFTYTVSWTPAAAGSFEVVAIGVDAQGDAMRAVGPSITVGN